MPGSTTFTGTRTEFFSVFCYAIICCKKNLFGFNLSSQIIIETILYRLCSKCKPKARSICACNLDSLAINSSTIPDHGITTLNTSASREWSTIFSSQKSCTGSIKRFDPRASNFYNWSQMLDCVIRPSVAI